MSGGSWDYVSYKLTEVADRLAISIDPLRRILATKIRPIAVALYNIEMVDSRDYALGDDMESIKAAIGDDAPKLVVAELTREARKLAAQLAIVQSELEKISPETNPRAPNEGEAFQWLWKLVENSKEHDRIEIPSITLRVLLSFHYGRIDDCKRSLANTEKK